MARGNQVHLTTRGGAGSMHALEWPLESRTTGSRVVRRVLNIVVALIGIIILAPVMILVAILIKLTSPGPVFYTQLRVGHDRRAAERAEEHEARHRSMHAVSR